MIASVYTISDSMVAKVERKTAESSLLHKLKVYSCLSNLSCIPKVYFFGEESGYYGLVLENVGMNIENLFRLKMEIMLSVDSTALAAVVGIQMVRPFNGLARNH